MMRVLIVDGWQNAEWRRHRRWLQRQKRKLS
eukprot:COSAG01_NODE_49568_length_371_cov_0.669118_1_plen_30_part_10